MRYFCADLHLGSRYWTAERGFNSSDEMDSFLIDKLSFLKETDKLYILGDVAHSKQSLRKLLDIPCKKVLIKGNHDKLELKEYLKVFYDIRACHEMDGLFFCHVPILDCQGRYPHIVHGHLHKEIIQDRRYMNICWDMCHKVYSLEELILWS